MAKIRAAKLIGEQKHEIIEIDMPQINDEELLVKVHICGYCASELHTWITGVYTDNNFLGHEVVGTIIKTGSRTKGFNVGDRVTGYILNGFAQYTKVHYTLATIVPENLEDKEALGEPLGCLVSGALRTPVEYGDKVSVIGLGYMGLGFMQLMKIKGATEITAIDVREDALKTALQFGATKSMKPQEVTDIHKVTTYGVNMDGGYNISVEASGSAPGLNLAIELASVHGVLSCVGFHQGGSRTINMELLNWKAINFINAHERRDEVMMNSIRKGLKLIAAGNLNMKDMITHTFSLEEIDEGFKALKTKPSGYIKGVMRFE